MQVSPQNGPSKVQVFLTFQARLTKFLKHKRKIKFNKIWKYQNWGSFWGTKIEIPLKRGSQNFELLNR